MYVYKRTESLTYRMREKYVSDLCRQLHVYQKEGHMCDVELTTGSHVVHAHRVVLAVRSSYFDTMFTGDFQERWQPRVDLSGSIQSEEALMAIVNFMYTGEITVSSANMEDILGAASLLMMDDVKNHCGQFMITNLSPVNCIHIWALADMYNLKDVGAICKAIACSRFRDLIQHRRSILETSGPFMVKLVREGVMDFLSPSELNSLMSRWLEHSPANRAEDCIKMVRCLKQQQLLGDDIKAVHMPHNFGLRDLRNYLSNTADSTMSMPSSFSTINKVLASWLVATKFEDSSPELGARTITTCMQTLQMHFYVTNRCKWFVKELQLPKDLRVKDFIGSMKDILIFQLEYDEILMCFCAHEQVQWKKAPSKVQIKHKGLLRGFDDCFRVFDGKLFHVIIYVSPIGSSNQVLCTLKVLYLETASESWRQVAFEQYTETKSRLSETVHMKVYTSSDSLFIFPSVFEAHKFARVCRKPDDLYHLEFLSRPTFAHRNFNPAECHISQCEDKLLVIPKHLGPYGVYDISTDQWNIHTRTTQPTPPDVPLPLDLRKMGATLIPVDMDMVAPVESIETHFYEQGYICIKVLAPYVCKMWKGAGDLSETDSFVWAELTPPSSEKLREFWVCDVSNAVLDTFEVIIYPDQSEARGQSPMAHCRLAGHDGHAQSAYPIHSSCHFTDARFAPYYDETFSVSGRSSSDSNSDGGEDDEEMDNSSDAGGQDSGDDLYNAPWLMW